MFPSSAVFMIATNNRTAIEECFKDSPQQQRFIFLNMGYLEEFFALTLCDDFVVPNSSFGLIASWLSNTSALHGRTKKMIFPRTWFAPPYNNHQMTADLYPEGAIIL